MRICVVRAARHSRQRIARARSPLIASPACGVSTKHYRKQPSKISRSPACVARIAEARLFQRFGEANGAYPERAQVDDIRQPTTQASGAVRKLRSRLVGMLVSHQRFSEGAARILPTGSPVLKIRSRLLGCLKPESGFSFFGIYSSEFLDNCPLPIRRVCAGRLPSRVRTSADGSATVPIAPASRSDPPCSTPCGSRSRSPDTPRHTRASCDRA